MPTTKPSEAVKRAIAILGGPVKAAKLLAVKGERYQTVQSWVQNRVPAEYCPAIERETALAGEKVRCEEMRPDVQWAVLRQVTKELTEVRHAA